MKRTLPPSAVRGAAWSLAAAAAVAATGCSGVRASVMGGGDDVVTPGDFVDGSAAAEPAERPVVPIEDDASRSAVDTSSADVAGDAAGPPGVSANASPLPAPPREAPTEPVLLDGMIGQINGRPVYADTVLADLEDQLIALADRWPAAEFRKRAGEVIAESVRGQLWNALILGEAERALTEQEWNGVRFMTDRKREELLRKFGRGSLAVAERRLREETGRSLDESLREYRNGLITDTYVRRNVVARINVSRRDIERYYDEHHAEFNPPPTRDVRLLVVGSDEADGVAERLNAGAAFTDLAADAELNRFPDEGRMGGLKGDAPFGQPAVDEAIAGLKEGEWAGPFDVRGSVWFVLVEKLDQPASVSRVDAQQRIENLLRDQQGITLRNRFLERLMREGSFTPPEQMAATLVEIAVNRYER